MDVKRDVSFCPVRHLSANVRARSRRHWESPPESSLPIEPRVTEAPPVEEEEWNGIIIETVSMEGVLPRPHIHAHVQSNHIVCTGQVNLYNGTIHIHLPMEKCTGEDLHSATNQKRSRRARRRRRRKVRSSGRSRRRKHPSLARIVVRTKVSRCIYQHVR